MDWLIYGYENVEDNCFGIFSFIWSIFLFRLSLGLRMLLGLFVLVLPSLFGQLWNEVKVGADSG